MLSGCSRLLPFGVPEYIQKILTFFSVLLLSFDHTVKIQNIFLLTFVSYISLDNVQCPITTV
jgi:hypothetical protein